MNTFQHKIQDKIGEFENAGFNQFVTEADYNPK